MFARLSAGRKTRPSARPDLSFARARLRHQCPFGQSDRFAAMGQIGQFRAKIWQIRDRMTYPVPGNGIGRHS